MAAVTVVATVVEGSAGSETAAAERAAALAWVVATATEGEVRAMEVAGTGTAVAAKAKEEMASVEEPVVTAARGRDA